MGVYWRDRRETDKCEPNLLQMIANAAALVLVNIELNKECERPPKRAANLSIVSRMCFLSLRY